MRAFIFILLVFVLIAGGAGALAAMQREGGPNPFADGCLASSEKITTPENCLGAPDGKLVEIGKGNLEHFLLLDMGAGYEGTGNLILHYKTANDVEIVVEFSTPQNNTVAPIEQKKVNLLAANSTVLVNYDHKPTPYRYVRIYASEERKYQLDAVRMETYRPDSDGDSLPDQWELDYGLNPLVSTGRDGPNDDLDGDLLTNKTEFDNHTHPLKGDTDDDSLPDKWELDHNLKADSNEEANGTDGDPDEDGLTNFRELSFGSHPNKKDTDKDGLNDLKEIEIGTNPNREDTDDDKLPDGWEGKHSLNPLNADGVNGPEGDPDQDLLLNLDELQAGANPQNPDSDADGTGDKVEVDRGSDPTNWDDGDLDGDGLSNGDEKNKYGSNEWKFDTDGDGLADAWEAAFGLGISDAAGNNGASGDPDNDGVDNLTEQAKGSSPRQLDTDEDGLPDAWEIRYCLNPNDQEGDNGPDGDPDQDGKSNFVEMGMESSPKIDCVP